MAKAKKKTLKSRVRKVETKAGRAASRTGSKIGRGVKKAVRKTKKFAKTKTGYAAAGAGLGALAAGPAGALFGVLGGSALYDNPDGNSHSVDPLAGYMERVWDYSDRDLTSEFEEYSELISKSKHPNQDFGTEGYPMLLGMLAILRDQMTRRGLLALNPKKKAAKRKVTKKKAAKRKVTRKTIEVGSADVDVDLLALHIAARPLRRNPPKRKNPAPPPFHKSSARTVVRVEDYDRDHRDPPPGLEYVSGERGDEIWSWDGWETVDPPQTSEWAKDIDGESWGVVWENITSSGDEQQVFEYVYWRRARPGRAQGADIYKQFRSDEYLRKPEAKILALVEGHIASGDYEPNPKKKAKRKPAKRKVAKKKAARKKVGVGSADVDIDFVAFHIAARPARSRKKNPSEVDHERVGTDALKQSEKYHRRYMEHNRLNDLLDTYKWLLIAHEELKYSGKSEPRIQARDGLKAVRRLILERM